ncbi:MAG: transposase, partial [Nitrosomonas sp.]|nr:transposase [Nitrosomonas sp.]
MSKKRKLYSSEFKAKVALAAIRGEETVPELAARHGLHPTQINSWKRQLIEQAAEVFSKDQSEGKAETSTKDDLHRVIGHDGRTRFFGQKAQSLSLAQRKKMIESNEKLSQTRQCQLLSLARSTFYYQPQPLDNEKLALLRKL